MAAELDQARSEAPEEHDALDAEFDASGFVPAGASDRLRLLKGELSREGFLALQVERALEPYVGVVDAGLLESMRQVMTAELAHDPLLEDLAARATQIES